MADQRPPLSDTQAKVLAYMVKFLELNDQLPTMAKIAEAFGWASPNAADTHVRAMEKKGYLARNELTNLMLARADIDAANAAYPWTVGSLNARPPLAVWLLAGGLALGLPAARLLTRPLALMRFSDSVAIGLGVRLGAMRIATLALSVALTGLAVAVAGPVGLVALIAPEAARYLGGQHGVPVLNAALAGALLTLLADWLGRTLLAPIEIPVGIVMAVIGAPYLLWNILRQPSGRQP